MASKGSTQDLHFESANNYSISINRVPIKSVHDNNREFRLTTYVDANTYCNDTCAFI